MFTQMEIEDMILGMSDLVKENRMLRKRINELELDVAIEKEYYSSITSQQGKKRYKVLCDIRDNNLSCDVAAANGWLTSNDYIEDWRDELDRRLHSS